MVRDLGNREGLSAGLAAALTLTAEISSTVIFGDNGCPLRVKHLRSFDGLHSHPREESSTMQGETLRSSEQRVRGRATKPGQRQETIRRTGGGS